VKLKATWSENLIRMLENGKPFSEACGLAKVGKARVLQEKRRNPEFRDRLEAVLERRQTERQEG